MPVVAKISDLKQDSGILQSRKTKFFVEKIQVEYDKEDETDTVSMKSSMLAGTVSKCEQEFFKGSDRAAVKLSIANKRMPSGPEPLQRLINRLLALENKMLRHNPPIDAGPESVRVQEEMENVWVKTYINIIIKEGDADYHLIIGDGKNFSPGSLMNVEISGLPERGSASYNVLKKVRDTYEQHRDGMFKYCSAVSLVKPGVSLPYVSIKGSLFYDIRHAIRRQHSGKGDMKPQAFWEIHPVTYIKFLN